MPACHALFTLVLLPPKPAKYYTSLNSSTPQQLLHFYVAVIRPVLEYCTPVWHYDITRLHAEQLEWIQKRAIHIVFLVACLIPILCSLLNCPPLNPDVTNFYGHSFKISVSHLLPFIITSPSRDICLVSAQNSHTVHSPIPSAKMLFFY